LFPVIPFLVLSLLFRSFLFIAGTQRETTKQETSNQKHFKKRIYKSINHRTVINYHLVLHHFNMTVHYNIEQLPVFTNAVVTIGTFDGVHTGHHQIIQLMLDEAKKVGGETVIITFNPHPRQVIAARQTELFLLNTLQEKISLLEKYGIRHLVVTPFTEAFSLQSAEDYIEQFLVKTFHPHTIIIGHDHRFGKSRSGNFELLEEKSAQYNYTVKEIPGFMLQDNTISSTMIRQALLKGNIDTANEYLGYPYFFSGTVVEGNKLGRTIGYPTANLKIEAEKKLIPGNGVYAVEVVLSGESSMGNSENLEQAGASNSSFQNRNSYFGMMNIGVRPTVEGVNRMIEVNIFDFDQEIYGYTLTIHIKKRLRNEQKFNGLEELKQQLAKDKEQAEEFLKVEN
jgi:riboflavin kinase / FMN adenylyltransferase